jgi:2-oxoglutarate dehydrogenase E1 component
VLQATRDSIRAIMMIRAYRMRGHLHADLDPLKLKADEPAPELDPESYGFTEADFSRKIFIDNYLGLEYATLPEMLAILQRTYCGTVGIEFMHISDPDEKLWIQERIEGPDKEISFTPEGKKAILNKLVEAEGFEKFLDVKFTAPSASASMAARRPFRRSSRSSSAAVPLASRISCSAWPIVAA